jgi:hypothetical protein
VTDDRDHWSAALWLNAVHVEHWLRELWPSWRRDDIRSDVAADGTWYWVSPDFDRGRSRVLGVERQVLERTPVSVLRDALGQANWRVRIEQTPLRVTQEDRGTWSIDSWAPDIEEKWFEDPRGGFFVAHEDSKSIVSAGGPAREARSFLALHGAGWSALGPADNRAATTYDLTELVPYLPGARKPAE